VKVLSIIIKILIAYSFFYRKVCCHVTAAYIHTQFIDCGICKTYIIIIIIIIIIVNIKTFVTSR
jgi:hypothetical protein